jgi:holo-[acyl-carrier protein] synthase
MNGGGEPAGPDARLGSADRPGSGALLGLGIDSVEIGRFGEVLARRPSIEERVFSPSELSYARSRRNPVPSLAARFAVKEAVMKALGVGIGAFDWVDVVTVRASGGAPHLQVTGRAALLAAERGVGGWFVSITHTDTIASAAVAAVS